MGCATIEEVPDRYKNLFEKGMIIYSGSVCDDNGEPEEVLCYANFECEGDDICIYKEPK